MPRPLRGDEPARNRNFRATDEEWSRWQRAAEAAGLSTSAWIRQALDAAADATADTPGR